MKQWQSYSALKQVKTEIEKLAAEVADALEQVLSTPAGEDKVVAVIQAPLAAFVCVPDTLKLLECQDLAFLASEIIWLLEQSTQSNNATAVVSDDVSLGLAFTSLLEFPALLDGALEHSGDHFQAVFTHLNRLRNARNAALVFNRQMLVEKQTVMLRQQFERDPGKLGGLLDNQLEFYEQACKQLIRDPANIKALLVLRKVVSNLGVLLRDYRAGTLWGLADAFLEVFDSELDEATTHRVLKIFAWLTSPLKEISEGGAELLEQDMDASTRETLLSQFRELGISGPLTNHVMQWYGLDPDLALAGEAGKKQLQSSHFGRQARVTVIARLCEEISALMETISELAEEKLISVDSMTAVQAEVEKLRQVLEFSGMPTLAVALNQDELSHISREEFLLRLARNLFSVFRQLSSEQENNSLALFGAVSGPDMIRLDAGRLHTIRAAANELVTVIDCLDKFLEHGVEALAPAIQSLSRLSSVFTMMNLGEQSRYLQSAADYLAGIKPDSELLEPQGSYQSLCHLVINQLWSLEQMTLGRDEDSKFYLERSIDFARRLEEQQSIEVEKDQEKAKDQEKEQEFQTSAASERATTLDDSDRNEIIPVLVPDVEISGLLEHQGLEVTAGSNSEELEIREIFSEECMEIFSGIATSLGALEKDKSQTEDIMNCRRYFHTLKGSGRLVGAQQLQALANAMEAYFDFCTDKGVISSEGLLLAGKAHALLPQLRDEFLSPEQNPAESETLAGLCEEIKDLMSAKSETSGEARQDGIPVHEAQVGQHAAVAQKTERFEPEPVITGFIREGRELVNRINELHTRIIEDSGTQDTRQKMQESLRLLEGAAESAEQAHLQQAATLLSVAYQEICGTENVKTLPVLSHLEAVLAFFGNALEGLEQGKPAESCDELASKFHSLIEQQAKQDDSNSLEVVAEASVTQEPESAALVEEVDQSVLAIFLEEAAELMEDMDSLFLRWQEDPADDSIINEYLRLLHTMKGSSALVQDDDLSKAAHDYETFIIDWKNSRQNFSNDFFTACDSKLHGLHDLTQLYARDSKGLILRKAELENTVNKLEDEAGNKSNAPEKTGPADTSIAEAECLSDQIETKKKPDEQRQASTPAPRRAAEPQTSVEEQVKVSNNLLKYLLNDADEINFSRNRLEKNFNDISSSLIDMDETLVRLKSYVKRLDESTRHNYLLGRQEDSRSDESRISDEFDALEMDRYTEMHEMALSLTEDYEDLQDIRANLSGKLKEVDHVLTGQQRLTNSLQDGLISSQMVPFSSIVPRLRRLVRQVSRELGKNVRFEVQSQQGNLDKNVMQSIITPLEHLIRNAIDHGIELPEARVEAGKDEQAVISISVNRIGANIQIEISDDGKGIDVEKVKLLAISRKIIKSDQIMGADEACQLIFSPGFSTADAVSKISGRGVGLDVVKSDITQIGGSISIASEYGKGTAFVMTLPLTSSLNRALIFQIQQAPYIALMNTLDGVLVEKLASLYQHGTDKTPVFSYGGKEYEYLYLGSLINTEFKPRPDSVDKSIALLLVSARGKNFALHVDAILESRDMVVKTFQKQLNSIPGIGGGVIMPDGNVAIVLELAGLLNQYTSTETMQVEKILQPVAVQKKGARKKVMVVDDSITVRKVTSKMLERNGLEVLTAKDGLEAIELLEQHLPDIILLDIEMPRMDGFEVATYIRKQPGPVNAIPIIMITSRIGDKHRLRAEAIGVNEYLCKPFQEDILLAHIDNF